MGEVQLTYLDEPLKGYPGQVADMNPLELVSKAAEGEIPFGYALEKGTSDRQVKKAAGGAFSGMAVRVHKANDYDGTEAKYNDEDAVRELKAGYIYADIDGSGAKDAPLSYIAASGKLSTAVAGGALGTAVADAGNTGDGAVSGYALAGGPAKVGTYVATCVLAATNGGSFNVVDPDGEVVGTLIVGVTFVGGGITVAVADGAADFIVGDSIDMTIVAGTHVETRCVLQETISASGLALVRVSAP